MDCEGRTCTMVALLTLVRPALTAGDAEKLPDVEINKLCASQIFAYTGCCT